MNKAEETGVRTTSNPLLVNKLLHNALTGRKNVQLHREREQQAFNFKDAKNGL
jgi:hypothetical protein